MKYDKNKAMVYALLKAVQCEFFGFFVMLFFWAVSKAMGLVANVMFGFTGLMCVVCIMADFAYKQGEAAGSAVKLHDEKISEGFGIVLGLIAMIPAAVSSLFLLLSKAGVIGNFIGGYKILNACLFPILDIFAHSADIKDMPCGVFGLVAAFLLLYPISSYVGFRLGFNKVDIEDKVVYKH